MTLVLSNLPIDILAGNKAIIRRHDDIFSEISMSFINDLSKLLNQNRDASYADINSLGFWLRNRNIKKYAKRYVDYKKRVGLGFIYHITPSNIPTNFAYSFIFGLISGNSNILKLSDKNNIQVDIIMNCIKKLFRERKYNELKKTNLFIRFNNDESINKLLSYNCDARVVWGGNRTIDTLRKFPLNYRAREINFPDRFSICVLNEEKIAKLKELELNILIKNFYNDTFLVDQNACSSPRLVVWINSKSKKGRKVFWKKLLTTIKNYNLDNSLSLDKYTILCNMLSNGSYKLNSYINSKKLYVAETQSLNNLNVLSSLKLGIFVEYSAASIEEVFKIDMPSLQTLSYFGIDKEDIINFFDLNRTRSIDRVVPVGNTLEMSMDWDGYSVPYILSRVIDSK